MPDWLKELLKGREQKATEANSILDRLFAPITQQFKSIPSVKSVIESPTVQRVNKNLSDLPKGLRAAIFTPFMSGEDILDVFPETAEPDYAKRIGGTFFDVATLPLGASKVPVKPGVSALQKLLTAGGTRAAEGLGFSITRKLAAGEPVSAEEAATTAATAFFANTVLSPKLTAGAGYDVIKDIIRSATPNPITGKLPAAAGFAKIPGTNAEDITKNLAKMGIKVTTEGDPIEPIINRITSIIEESRPLNQKVSKMRTEELSKRFTQFRDVVEDGLISGKNPRDIINQASTKLGGKLPDAVYDSIPLTRDEGDELVKRVLEFNSNWRINEGQAKTAVGAIDRLLEGQRVRPHEIDVLRKVFGSELGEALSRRLEVSDSIKIFLRKAINTPRELVAGLFDQSAPLRQGIMYMLARPSKGVPTVFKALGQAFDDEYYRMTDLQMRSGKNYGLGQRFGLDLPELDGYVFSEKEEVYRGSLLEKLPFLKDLRDFSSRGYVGYLNNMRSAMFDEFVDTLTKRGLTPDIAPQEFRSAARLVNVAFGRGEMGRLDRIGDVLADVGFSPRLVASRFNMLDPRFYASLAPEMRKQAMSDFLRFLTVGATIVTSIEALYPDQVSVEKDPRSADFMKVKVGDTRYDIWGGFQQMARYAAQFITNQEKVTTTGEIRDFDPKEFPFGSRASLAGRFLRSKESPQFSLLHDWAAKRTFLGEEFPYADDAEKKAMEKWIERFIPLYIQDINDAADSLGIGKALLMGIPGFFGAGFQTYNERAKSKSSGRSKKNDGLVLPGGGRSNLFDTDGTFRLPR